MTTKDWTGNSKAIYSCHGASNHSETEREANDYYATPPSAVEMLLELEDFSKNIMEPACGEGHIAEVLKSHGYDVLATDLIDRGYGTGGVDFFEMHDPMDMDIISNPPYKCYSSDTEIKTKRGWVKYIDLMPGDEVLSVNIETLQIEWSKIQAVIEKDVDEKLINFKHRFMDILVTKDHRMFSYSTFNNKPQYKNGDVFLAKDINSTSYMPIMGYKWDGNCIDNFSLPGCYVSDGKKNIWHEDKKIDMMKWAEFLGIWIADGYCRHTKNSQGNQRYTIGIKQHICNKEKILQIMNELGFHVKEYKEGNKSNFEIHNKQLWLYLSQFGTSFEKFVPTEIKDGNIDIISAFMKGYTFGDSYKNNCGSIVFSSVSKQLMEDVHEMLFKLGYLTHINHSFYGDKHTELYSIVFNSQKKTQRRILYCGNSKYKKEIDYNGKVFCLQIEKNHFFMLRRNGFEFISGNCAQEFVEHAMDIVTDGHKIAMFLKLTFLEGQGRRELFKKYPPKTVYVSTSRIGCAKNGEFKKDKNGNLKADSAVAYCWYIWEKGFEGNPTIKWFN